jgi:hypothetical protein
MLLTLFLFFLSAAVIYLACEFFVNGVEWVGHRFQLGATATGTVLAAFGTALPESAVTFMAVVFGETPEQKDIGVGAAMGGPLVLATLAYAVVGLALWRARRGQPAQANCINADQRRLARDQAWFMGINNQRAGELCGEAIADALKDQGRELEYLVLFFNSENGDLVKKRMGGAIDGLKNKGVELRDDQIEWIDMGGGGSDTTVAGRDKFAAWLTAHPDVRTVGTVAVNDETTQGLYAAAETANRTQDCLMGSHNVSEQFKELAKQGGDAGKCWLGSVAYHPEMYGEYIIPLAIDIFTGKNTDPTKHVLMDPEWIPMAAVEAYSKDYDAYVAKW